MKGGEWLRKLREELHVSRVAVERFTSGLAIQADNQQYRIRRGRLTEIEQGNAAPDIFEVQSLSECYKVSFDSIVQVFGVKEHGSQKVAQISSYSNRDGREWPFTDANQPLSLTFQSKIRFDTTRLVTESPEELGVPAAVCQSLDAGRYRLGIIALNDDTMHDLVPGGSVVVIDKSYRTVQMGEWKTIQERPIYFVWHERGYSCTWCHLTNDTLLTVPHPTSRQPVMMFKIPRAATVLGRIVHVWPPMVLPKSAA
jgi:hypothetical protein